jgi:hypothetical protein
MSIFKIGRLAAILAGLAGCSTISIPSTATMPDGALGSNGDTDVRSLQVAAYDFSHPMVNDPAEAVNAIAALDYMGGKLNSSPRWLDMPGLWSLEMLKSRQKVRQFIGISENAPSQAVVNTMLALAVAYRNGNQADIQRLLSQPIFTAPPDQIQAHLSNIPLIASVNSATSHAEEYSYPIDYDNG